MIPITSLSLLSLPLPASRWHSCPRTTCLGDRNTRHFCQAGLEQWRHWHPAAPPAVGTQYRLSYTPLHLCTKATYSHHSNGKLSCFNLSSCSLFKPQEKDSHLQSALQFVSSEIHFLEICIYLMLQKQMPRM